MPNVPGAQQCRGRRMVVTAALTVAVAALLGLAAGCTPAPPASASVRPPNTGVLVRVLAGPTCPVEQAGQSPCVRPVSGAVILARDASHSSVGSCTSDAAGTCFLALPPGAYSIEPQPVEGLLGTARPATVVVSGGPPAAADFTYDTGIR
jgi:hypothetical protein